MPCRAIRAPGILCVDGSDLEALAHVLAALTVGGKLVVVVHGCRAVSEAEAAVWHVGERCGALSATAAICRASSERERVQTHFRGTGALERSCTCCRRPHAACAHWGL